MNRRKFNKATSLSALGLISGLAVGCQNSGSQNAAKAVATAAEELVKKPFFKLSLAQWSLHKAIQGGTLDPFMFAEKAKSLGFSGLEYVNDLYNDHVNAASTRTEGVKSFTKKALAASKAAGVENVLIMIDGEGDLGIQNRTERLKGVDNHKKWVDAAKELGCHSIRINLFGDGTMEQQEEASSDSMRLLGEFAKDKNINIIVENHGGFSSDPNWVKRVMGKVNMPNVGTLPDFGNFCIAREGGERWGAPCINEYPDIYQAVDMMMPYAKAVSAKSYAFDDQGDETKIDYYKMIRIVKKAGYTGYVGVEFEGDIPEEEGIIATRDLLIKAGSI